MRVDIDQLIQKIQKEMFNEARKTYGEVFFSAGKSPEDLLEITADKIIDKIGRLPEEVHHCAYLAAATVHSAVDKYMIQQIKKDQD